MIHTVPPETVNQIVMIRFPWTVHVQYLTSFRKMLVKTQKPLSRRFSCENDVMIGNTFLLESRNIYRLDIFLISIRHLNQTKIDLIFKRPYQVATFSFTCSPTQYNDRADFRPVPSQWETLLQSNTVSHWLGANLESALNETSCVRECGWFFVIVSIFSSCNTYMAANMQTVTLWEFLE